MSQTIVQIRAASEGEGGDDTLSEVELFAGDQHWASVVRDAEGLRLQVARHSAGQPWQISLEGLADALRMAKKLLD